MIPESVISLILMQETYLDQSIEAASSIQKSFVNNLNRKDRTVKQAGFVVLKYTYMPSVLVETGFLTNSSEGAYLNSSKGQTNMANAVAKAIIDYKSQREAGVGKQVSYTDQSDVEVQAKQSNLTFKIQIAASKKNIDLKPYNFKGLTSLTKQKSGAVYRYFYQQSANYEQAQKDLKVAKSKGFKSSFIVAFNGDKKITISEALRLLK
jgi:N-acetylmuramoyl-L-alanine amidase